jgi:hypothetical protein
LVVARMEMEMYFLTFKKKSHHAVLLVSLYNNLSTLFHIPETQAEPKIQPDSVADNLHRKAVILISEITQPGQTPVGPKDFAEWSAKITTVETRR